MARKLFTPVPPQFGVTINPPPGVLSLSGKVPALSQSGGLPGPLAGFVPNAGFAVLGTSAAQGSTLYITDSSGSLGNKSPANPVWYFDYAQGSLTPNPTYSAGIAAGLNVTYQNATLITSGSLLPTNAVGAAQTLMTSASNVLGAEVQVYPNSQTSVGGGQIYRCATKLYNWTPGVATSNNTNLKASRLWSGSPIVGGPQNSMWVDEACNGSGGGIAFQDGDPTQSFGGHIPQANTLTVRETQYQESSAQGVRDGFAQYIADGNFIADPTHRFITSTSGTPGSMTVSVLDQIANNVEPAGSTAAVTWEYIDSTLQRIMWSPEPLWQSPPAGIAPQPSATRSINIPTSWATTGGVSTLSFVNQPGSASSLVGQYLYVVDSTGAGHQIGQLTAPAFDFFISTTGSDSNAGTQASPWAITAINTKHAQIAGKRVGLLNGTYPCSQFMNNPPTDGYTCGLSLNGAGGTSTHPTVIQAVNQGQAILDLQLTKNNGPLIGTSDTTTGWITIDGLKIINGGAKLVHFGQFGVVGTSFNIPGWVVQNCEFTGQNTSGFTAGNNFSCIELQGGLSPITRNNYAHGNAGNTGPTDGNHYTPYIQWQTRGALLEFNTFVGACTAYGKEDANAGITARYNYLDGTGWTTNWGLLDFAGEVTSATGFSTSIHHNVIVAQSCDQRSHNAGDFFADPVDIHNNTIVILNSSSPTPTGIMMNVAPGLLTHYNNIVYSQATGDMDLFAFNVNAPGLMDYDLFFSSTGTYVYGSFSSQTSQTRGGSSSFTTWKASMPAGTETHAINATNPLLISLGSTGASNYKLQGTSPALGAGSSNGTTGGTACDMGAWGLDVSTGSPPTRIGSNLAGAPT